MATETFLFKEIIFGPIKSRRLGDSLGINLLPTESKLCNFDCIYCECGWTDLKHIPKTKFHPAKAVLENLEIVLLDLKCKKGNLDHITFAGNGEPTMHPEFHAIVDGTIVLRNKYFPKCNVAVLSNAAMLGSKNVILALNKVDTRILKLDAGTEETFQKINKPIANRNLAWIVDHLVEFKGKLTIQTMFLRGSYNGIHIDNTTDKEVEAWMSIILKIKPELVMLYSLDRATPAKGLEKITKKELDLIAQKLNGLNIKTQVN